MLFRSKLIEQKEQMNSRLEDTNGVNYEAPLKMESINQKFRQQSIERILGKRMISSIDKLPKIKRTKIHTKQATSINGISKENIHPSDYSSIALNPRLIHSVNRKRRVLNSIINEQCKYGEPKEKLALPDDSNYNKIVKFVKELKNTIKHNVNSCSKSICDDEIRKYKFNIKIRKLPNTNFIRKKNINCSNVVGGINPLHGGLSQSVGRRTSMKYWIDYNETNLMTCKSIIGEIPEQLSLFPLLKTETIRKHIEFSIPDIYYAPPNIE